MGSVNTGVEKMGRRERLFRANWGGVFMQSVQGVSLVFNSLICNLHCSVIMP